MHGGDDRYDVRAALTFAPLLGARFFLFVLIHCSLFSPWWNHDCLNKVLRIVTANGDHLSEVALLAFVDLLIGDTSLFALQVSWLVAEPGAQRPIGTNIAPRR